MHLPHGTVGDARKIRGVARAGLGVIYARNFSRVSTHSNALIQGRRFFPRNNAKSGLGDSHRKLGLFGDYSGIFVAAIVIVGNIDRSAVTVPSFPNQFFYRYSFTRVYTIEIVALSNVRL